MNHPLFSCKSPAAPAVFAPERPWCEGTWSPRMDLTEPPSTRIGGFASKAPGRGRSQGQAGGQGTVPGARVGPTALQPFPRPVASHTDIRAATRPLWWELSPAAHLESSSDIKIQGTGITCPSAADINQGCPAGGEFNFLFICLTPDMSQGHLALAASMALGGGAGGPWALGFLPVAVCSANGSPWTRCPF